MPESSICTLSVRIFGVVLRHTDTYSEQK